MKIELKGKLPTLNEYIDAERRNKFIAAKIKRKTTELVAWSVKGSGWTIKGLSDFTFTWYVPNKRSDPDNVAFATKFVLDGLVVAGVLPSDSMKYVRSICHFFEIGEPRVIVEV